MVNANLSTILDFSTISDFCVVLGNTRLEEALLGRTAELNEKLITSYQ